MFYQNLSDLQKKVYRRCVCCFEKIKQNNYYMQDVEVSAS